MPPKKWSGFSFMLDEAVLLIDIGYYQAARMESGISRDELRVAFEVAYSQTSASLIGCLEALEALSFLLSTTDFGNHSTVSHLWEKVCRDRAKPRSTSHLSNLITNIISHKPHGQRSRHRPTAESYHAF